MKALNAPAGRVSDGRWSLPRRCGGGAGAGAAVRNAARVFQPGSGHAVMRAALVAPGRAWRPRWRRRSGRARSAARAPPWRRSRAKPWHKRAQSGARPLRCGANERSARGRVDRGVASGRSADAGSVPRQHARSLASVAAGGPACGSAATATSACASRLLTWHCTPTYACLPPGCAVAGPAPSLRHVRRRRLPCESASPGGRTARQEALGARHAARARLGRRRGLRPGQARPSFTRHSALTTR
jgi:hypothetical protein